MKQHKYQTAVRWTGNSGTGTSAYKNYSRMHEIKVVGKPTIEGSSDVAFNGDPALYNPEELFLASLSSCHMLWYLHLCSVHAVVVTAYEDNAQGFMEEYENGSGRFTKVVLRPVVTLQEMRMKNLALQLHAKASEMCFIANSCNFKIEHDCSIILSTII